MPKSYIVSKPPLDQSVEDWLKWTRSDFEHELSAILPTLAAIMGINKAGDIQYLFMPTIIPNTFAGDDEASAIIGNVNDSHSKPSFIHTDTTDLGSVYVIDTYDIIPDEIRPEEPLLSNFLADTSYAKATVPLGMALIPNVMPIFFGQHLIEGSIHDADFDDNMESISPIHLKWAKLLKEHIAQQENDGDDIIKIVDRLNKKLKKDVQLVLALLVLSMHTNQTRASSSLIFSQTETSGLSVRPTSRHISFDGKDSRQSYKTPLVRLSHKILIGNKKGETGRLRHQEPTPTVFLETAINRTQCEMGKTPKKHPSLS